MQVGITFANLPLDVIADYVPKTNAGIIAYEQQRRNK